MTSRLAFARAETTDDDNRKSSRGLRKMSDEAQATASLKPDPLRWGNGTDDSFKNVNDEETRRALFPSNYPPAA
jgi:phage/plasmid primase-like uncharacterized protein